MTLIVYEGQPFDPERYKLVPVPEDGAVYLAPRLGGGKGGGTVTTTTQTSPPQPWSGQSGFLREIYGQPGSYVSRNFGEPQLLGARHLYKQGKLAPPFFPDKTYVDFAPETETALGATTARALAGSPLNPAAQGQTYATLRGDYLTPGNPYISGVMDRLSAQVLPRVDAAFLGANRSGSPLHAYQRTRALAEAASPFLFGSYEAERGRQFGAAQFAPGLAREDYYDIGQLGGVGARREQLAEAALADRIARYNYEQNRPARALAQYAAFIGAPIAGGGTVTAGQPYFRQSPFLTGLGALASIGGALGGLGWRPFG